MRMYACTKRTGKLAYADDTIKQRRRHNQTNERLYTTRCMARSPLRLHFNRFFVSHLNKYVYICESTLGMSDIVDTAVYIVGFRHIFCRLQMILTGFYRFKDFTLRYLKMYSACFTLGNRAASYQSNIN